MTDRSAVSHGTPRTAITKHPTAEQLAAGLRLWHRRHRTRRQLRRLDDQRLSDLGLAADARITECRKWFWQK